MTPQLAIDHIHPRRRFYAALGALVGITSRPRERRVTTAARFDPELQLNPPFALLNPGPR